MGLSHIQLKWCHIQLKWCKNVWTKMKLRKPFPPDSS